LVPAVLPAVRRVVWREDGTITGPPPSRRAAVVSGRAPELTAAGD
jgi:hypothetical protein